MTTPIARALSEQYPSCQITYATNLDYLNGSLPAVLKHNPYIDQVVGWDQINSEEYDVVLDLHCPCVSHEVPGAPPVSRMDLFAKSIGLSLDNKRLVYVAHPDELALAKEKLELTFPALSRGAKLVIASPFASNIYRSIDPFLLKETIRAMRVRDPNLVFLVLDHTVKFISPAVDWSGYAHSNFRNLPVREIAALLPFASLLICPDSAMLHLGDALSVNTLALFGPTDARARCDSYPTVTPISHGAGLRCYPCWYRSPQCRHQSCWKSITPEDTASTALSLLSGQRPLQFNVVLENGSEAFERTVLATEII